MRDKLEGIIFYFEGTCEFCLANRGIDKYKMEVANLISSNEVFEDDIMARLYFAYSVIEYKLDNIEKAFQGWNKSLEYAQKVNDRKYIGKIYSYFAIYYYIKNHKEKEMYYFDSAKDIFKELEDYGELAAHYINILWYKRYEIDPIETLEYMDKALHYVQFSDSKKNARVYLHLGYIHKSVFNNFIRGIEYLISCYQLCREYGLVEMESMTFHQLADGYLKLDYYQETIDIYLELINNEKYKNITPNLKNAILCNLISCYIKIRELEEAKKYLEELDKQIHNVQLNIREQYIGISCWIKAKILVLEGVNVESAVSLMNRCEAIYEKCKNNFIIEEFDYIMADTFGELYFELGDYQKAINYYKKMNKISQRYSIWNEKESCEKLALAYEKSDNYEEAIHYYKNSDKILNIIKENNLEDEYSNIYKAFIKELKEQEINELSLFKNNLDREVYIDALTQIYNRHFFDKYIESLKGDLEKEQSELSILMIDIDYFKKYNDNYGHIKGDEVLYQVAQTINNSLCSYKNKVIRYGGEEFIVFLENISRCQAEDAAKKIVSNINSQGLEHLFSHICNHVTVSIGLATKNCMEKQDIDQLIEKADQALYKSKNSGRNKYSIAN